MTVGLSVPVRVFVSYSHDSVTHKERVLALANRLRHEGVDAHIDAYEDSPPQGWPSWMIEQARDAAFVLIVCTKTYYRRLTGQERDGAGLGARWEGNIITQAIYDGGGKNEKFIPVFFDPADRASIPEFLKGATHYDLSSDEGYEHLYRRLTQQPRVVRPSLGAIRNLGTSSAPLIDVSAAHEEHSLGKQSSAPHSESTPLTDDRELILLGAQLSEPAWLHALSIEEDAKITITALPTSPEQRMLLESFTKHRSRVIYLAYGLTALQGRLDEVRRRRDRGVDVFTLSLVPGEFANGGGLTEMATTNYSADDIAELRARRLLLDESLPGTLAHGRKGGDQLLETLVAGYPGSVSIARSPLPPLFESLGRDLSARFLDAARLVAVLWLRATGTVEHVLKLELEFVGQDGLSVNFHGVRRKVYTNREAPHILVEGVCPLL